MVKSQFLLHHFKDTVLQWCAPLTVIHADEVVLGALDIDHVGLGGLVLLQAGVAGELKDLLLRDDDCVVEVEAGQVAVLKGVIHLIDLIKDLPSHVKLDLLSHDLHLVAVLILKERRLRELLRVALVLEFLVEARLPFLH